MALLAAQVRNYLDRRDLYRKVGGSYVPVDGEQDQPCKLLTKAEFDERAGVLVLSIASRRFSKSIHEELGRATQAGDCVRVRQAGQGSGSWFAVKGDPERHPNLGSRLENYQAYDLASTPDPTLAPPNDATQGDPTLP